jgi:hypothetical protein
MPRFSYLIHKSLTIALHTSFNFYIFQYQAHILTYLYGLLCIYRRFQMYSPSRYTDHLDRVITTTIQCKYYYISKPYEQKQNKCTLYYSTRWITRRITRYLSISIQHLSFNSKEDIVQVLPIGNTLSQVKTAMGDQ